MFSVSDLFPEIATPLFATPLPPPSGHTLGPAAVHKNLLPVVAPVAGIVKSFAAVVANGLLTPPLARERAIISDEGGFKSVRIPKSIYEERLKECKFSIIGRISLAKGDIPWKHSELKLKLSALWGRGMNWKLISLGRGFYHMVMPTEEAMQAVWGLGSIVLKPGIMRFLKWTPGFDPDNHRSSSAQVWVRFYNLPWELWDKRIIADLARAVGTPLRFDRNTIEGELGHYARVLVDVDLSKDIQYQLRVDVDNRMLWVNLEYENLPDLCSFCMSVGHSGSNCRRKNGRDKNVHASQQEKTNPQQKPTSSAGKPEDSNLGKRQLVTSTKMPSVAARMVEENSPPVNASAKDVTLSPFEGSASLAKNTPLRQPWSSDSEEEPIGDFMPSEYYNSFSATNSWHNYDDYDFDTHEDLMDVTSYRKKWRPHRRSKSLTIWTARAQATTSRPKYQAHTSILVATDSVHILTYKYHTTFQTKEVYHVTKLEKRNWKTLDKSRYSKPLIFHDSRLAFRPTPAATTAMFMWLPFGLVLSIIRMVTGILLPFKLTCFLHALTGAQIIISKPKHSSSTTTTSPANHSGFLFVCNHRTLLDPIYISLALMRPVAAVTYSMSRFNEVISPIRTVRLVRDRETDRKKMNKMLRQGDVVICPEGTTCREPFLLRFSPLFAEITDEIVPVSIDVKVTMFYGSTASGFKCLDPIFQFLNPRSSYIVKILEKLPTAAAQMSKYDVANTVQREIAKTLGFECSNLTRKDKYIMLAGNEGIV